MSPLAVKWTYGFIYDDYLWRYKIHSLVKPRNTFCKNFADRSIASVIASVYICN